MPNVNKSAKAPKNSTGGTIVYKYLSKNFLLKSEFSETPNTYLIGIDGLDLENKKIEVSIIYEEFHPLMAVGRAVVEFHENYFCAHIVHIWVRQRIRNNR